MVKEKISTEQIMSLIDANQTAIKQLGKDIVEMEKKMQNRSLQLQNEFATARRDIADRWQYLKDLTDTINKTIEGIKK